MCHIKQYMHVFRYHMVPISCTILHVQGGKTHKDRTMAQGHRAYRTCMWALTQTKLLAVEFWELWWRIIQEHQVHVILYIKHMQLLLWISVRLLCTGSQSLGRDPSRSWTVLFQGSHIRFCIAEVYIITHNSSQMAVMKLQIMGGRGHHTMQKCVKASPL